MTTQFDFTNNEWSDIAALPVLVGLAVAKAEDSGVVGSYLEIRTLAHTIGEKAPDTAAHGLIEAISTIDVKQKIAEYEDTDPELLADIAVKAVGIVVKVLDDKAKVFEAKAYRRWIYNVAEQVANAAREGGARVSAGEAGLLARLETALA